MRTGPFGARHGGSVVSGGRELIPGVLCVAVFVALAGLAGGYAITSWAPAGMFLLGLLGLTAFAYQDRLGALTLANRLALAFLAAFVIWNYASIAWAEVQGIAWDGANRALLYLVVYTLFSIVLWQARTAGIVLGLYAVSLAALGVVVLVDAASSSEAASSLINGRFAEPTDYPNAVAALFIGGFWPAIFLASRRETPWAVRGLMLSAAGLLIQLALLPQSRGGLIVFPFALLTYLAVVPSRLRALFFVALVGAATALVAGPILDVFTVAEDEGDVAAALARARDGMILSAGALLVLGMVVSLLDRRLELTERTQRRTSTIGTATVAVLAIVGTAAVFATIGDPISWTEARWQDFKGDYDEQGFGESRFSGDLGSGRYDFWRVALEDEFANSPLVGAGSDNFAETYLQNRTTSEEPLYPHSLPIRVLAGTGIVGATLLVGFVVSAMLAAGRTRRSGRTAAIRGIPAVALAATAYFVMHSAGDWHWTFTAITMPIFAWLGMAAGLTPARATPADQAADGGAAHRAPWLSRAAAAVALVATALAAVSLMLPLAAARDVNAAAAGWRADPTAAFELLDRARAFNFLSARADLTAGTIALRLDDLEEARDAFERALEREPSNWYGLLELGTIDALEGRRRSAVRTLVRARNLNPDEPLIVTALRRAPTGKPLSPRRIDRELLDRVCVRVGATDETRFCR